MNLKKKIKGFFTLTRKANSGFTLVELIVVIAILAILAGVAVPTYNGYIKKAEIAGDETLLRAVNEAFAAACSANGSDIYMEKTASAVLTEGTVTSVNPYNDQFMQFFTGNEDAKFKRFRTIMFDANKHLFVNAENGVTVSLPGGGSLELTPEQVETILESTYADMGAATLTGQIDSVADLASKLIYDGLISGVNAADSSNIFYKMTGNSEYMASIGLTEEKIMEITNNGENMQAMADYLANSLVVSAANSSLSITAKDAAEKLEQDPNAYIADIKTRLNSTDTAGGALAEAALVYGVYTSYVNTYFSKDDAKAKLDAVDGSAGLIEALNEMQASDNWDEYMSGQGKKDVNAYLEAMKVINTSTSGENKSTADVVYGEGFSGGELEQMLLGLFGNQ